MNLYIIVLILALLAKWSSMFFFKLLRKEKQKTEFLSFKVIELKENIKDTIELNNSLEKLYKKHHYMFFTKYIYIILNSMISLLTFYIVFDLQNILSFFKIEYTFILPYIGDITKNTYSIYLFIFYLIIYLIETYMMSDKNTKWYMYLVPIISCYLIFFVMKFKIYIILFFITRTIIGMIYYGCNKYKQYKNKKSLK